MGIGRLGAALRVAALGAALAGVPGASGAATYYVDPQSGSDANPGTSAGAPWRTPPGTRNTSNSGFVSGAWGAIRTTSRVACGDLILLRGGATQTSSQGGAWLIDPTYYSSCTGGTPITLKVATSSEWPGSSGPFTLDGTGVAPTFGVYDSHTGLVNVAKLSGIHIRGASASQRLIVQDSTGYAVSTHTTGRTTQESNFWLDHAELRNSDSGFNMGAWDNWKVSNSVAHDIYEESGWQTGLNIDHVSSRGAFVDVEAYNTGGNTAGFNDDGFFMVGGRSVWCVRCYSHNNRQRGVNVGIIWDPNSEPYRFRFRDLVTHDNGAVCNLDCLGNGLGGSGDDHSTNIRATVVGAKMYRNQEGAFWAYGGLGLEVWNATMVDTNYNRHDVGSFLWDRSANQTLLMNSVDYPSIAGVTWGYSSATSYQPNLPPIVRSSCFRHKNSTSEALGRNWDGGAAGTYAAPDSPHNDASNKTGNACVPNFTSVHATSYAASNFTPGPGSSLIDAGRFLMLADGGGTSSTSLRVKSNGGSSDPRDFFIGSDSYLNPSLDDREIQIEGCGVRHVQTMTANTITLDQACTWAANAGVSLPWSGTRPDVGAVESGGTGTPPPGPPPPPTLLPIES
jgi:hypothetical protein